MTRGGNYPDREGYPGVPHLRGELANGCLPYLKNDFLATLEEAANLADTSKSGMCSFWVENRLVLMITKPEYVYEFKMHCQQYMQSHVALGGVFPGLAALNHHTIGLEARRTYHHRLFQRNALDPLKVLIAEISDKHVDCLKKTGVIEEAGRYFRKFTLELAARLFMGIDNFAEMDSDGVLDYVTELLAGFNEDGGLYLMGLKEWSTDLLDPEVDIETKQRDQFTVEMKKKLQTLLLSPHEDKIKGKGNLLDALWNLGAKAQGNEEQTLETLFPDAFFFFVGGIVTTLGDSFPLIIKLINDHPEVRDKLMAELDSAKDMNVENLPYLGMVIKESFRLNIPLPVIPARTVNQSFIFHGIEINEGDSILISPHVCHRAASVWRDPDKFNPERFSAENEPAIPKGAYFPFGLGGRDCIGRHYAMCVLKTLIAKLYGQFHLTPLNNETTIELSGVTMVTDRLQINLTPREPKQDLHQWTHLTVRC